MHPYMLYKCFVIRFITTSYTHADVHVVLMNIATGRRQQAASVLSTCCLNSLPFSTYMYVHARGPRDDALNGVCVCLCSCC